MGMLNAETITKEFRPLLVASRLDKVLPVLQPKIF